MCTSPRQCTHTRTLGRLNVSAARQVCEMHTHTHTHTHTLGRLNVSAARQACEMLIRHHLTLRNIGMPMYFYTEYNRKARVLFGTSTKINRREMEV